MSLDHRYFFSYQCIQKLILLTGEARVHVNICDTTCHKFLKNLRHFFISIWVLTILNNFPEEGKDENFGVCMSTFLIV